MKQKVLKVLDDFYEKNIKNGDTVSFFEGTYRILDMNYQNAYGKFVLCEWLEEKEDADPSNWKEQKRVEPDPNSPFEILGSIHAPGYRNLLGGIGYYAKNRLTNEMIGLSFDETWNVIFHEGASNAYAMKSQLGN